MFKRILLATALISAVAGLAVPSASASRNLLVGIYDEPSTIGRPDWAFPKYKALRVKVLRTNLYWGDVLGVAKNRRPAQPTNPADPAYDWVVYDRTVNQAKANGIQMVFSILWTPRWAGPRKNGPPRRMADLRNFAIAAAKRYTGSYTPIPDAKPFPSVKYWMAWNEPNNPVFLSPQFRRVGSRYVTESPRIYSQMCNAIYSGVKTVRSANKVACGVTAPRGNNSARSVAAVDLPDLLRQGDEDAGERGTTPTRTTPTTAHRLESPDVTARPRRARRRSCSGTSTTSSRVIGSKRLWLTEYGYQTPPDGSSGSRSRRRPATCRSRSRSPDGTRAST